ncbi:peptidoglycan amidohydrolase family protein [Acinetobacter courvalinii]|uniref:peptidoglycan amidohydrolase family protein n=1 Tax=Acinetobacter courvalinii TaxID=280147 RepID=UPI003A8B01D8
MPNPDNISIGQIIKIPYQNKNQKSNHSSQNKSTEKNISQPVPQKRIESKDISDEYTKETGKPMKVAQDATSPCICKQYDLIWGRKVSCDFRKRVIEIAKNLWPNDSINMASQLMAVMHLETAGTFNPKIGTFISKKLTDDAKGGYVGLIQFGQYAAIDLKIKRSELSQMTAVKQLDYVEKYYQLGSAHTKIKNLTGLYLWVNYPKNVKENRLDDEDIVYAAPKDAEVTSEKFLNSPYHQNPSFMKEDGEYVRKGKEVITQGVKNGSTKVWEVQREIEKHFNNGNKQENKEGNFSCAYEQVKQNSSKTLDIEIFAKTLRSRAEPASIGKCAKYVRIALEAAGANTTGHPVSASDWGPTLIKNGYKEISEVFNQPIKGDIYIITKTSTHKYGHIAGYDGSQWISDFKQKSQVIYRDKVDYRYFRIQ